METLDADAPAPAPAPGHQTLAAGELVWAKTKGRYWWPARLRAACSAGTFSVDALVSCFGDAHDDTRRATQLRPFADPAADDMARHSRARVFVSAVEGAHSHAVALLHKDLTCACARPPSPPDTNGTIGVANLEPSEFLASLRDAALDVSSVGLVHRARLKSWIRALAQGWGPAGAGYYPRHPVDDLVDKIDLDVPAGEDKDAADWVADHDDRALERPQETPTQKKRSVASLMEELDAGEDEITKNDSGTWPGLSAKRERKKSKYLSPPYTNLGGILLVQKAADLPKESLPNAAQDDKKVLLDNVAAQEVLLLVQGFGEDIFHRSRFPKAAKGFLGFFRSSAFVEGADYDSYEAHECPAEKNVFAKPGADIESLVSDSCAALKQGKCVLKSSRKKDQDGSGGGSSIKRKKREITSPVATHGCGVSITPAIPIRQVKAEDIRSQMTAGGGARGMGVGIWGQKNKSLIKSPISAAESGAIKPGQEQDQANGGYVVKTPVDAGDTLSNHSAKKNDEDTMKATMSETDIRVDTNVQSVIVDLPVRSVPMEPMESEANIAVDTNEQSVVVDVPVRSGSLPTHGDTSQTADGDTSQTTDGNKDHTSVEVRTVQESYASLEAMVPEMLKKVEVTNGTNVITTSHVLKGEGQKGEQPNQKKTADGAIANHSSGEATNATCPDLANSTPKKKKKKAAQHFGNPAALLLDFTPGVVLPSKEELLSAFGKFGFLIEPETEIVKDIRSARVVFGKSAEAEAAYNSAETLGMFGPPFATPRLHYLPPIKLGVPPPSPASKPPLADIRKNLEKMISSLTGHSSLKKATSSDGPKPVSENLLGEMQGLLAKVDKMLSGPSTSTPP